MDNHPDVNLFSADLDSILNACQPRPYCKFLFAIEELEAWYFGDMVALLASYPNAKNDVLDAYVQDSQVGTWEILAEAIYPGGVKALKKLGVQGLDQKRIWAKDIAPKMDVENNRSLSFCAFRDALRQVARGN